MNKNDFHPYGRFFLRYDLFTEADDETTDEEETETENDDESNVESEDESNSETDDESETVDDNVEDQKPVYNKNTKVIEVKPNNRSRIKFEDDLTPEDEMTDEDTPDDESEITDTETSDGSEESDEDFTTSEDDTNTDDVSTDNSEDSSDDSEGSDEDFTTSEDDTSTDENNSDGNEESGDGPDVSDDSEFTDSETEGEGEQSSEGDGNASQDNNSEEKKGPGLEYDSTRKYNLFKNFVSLSNAISNYITKLENNMGEDLGTNQIYKKSTEKLREIYDLCNDYMMMKFEISSYVQSLLFFQNLVIMVQMVFDLIAKHTQMKKK